MRILCLSFWTPPIIRPQSILIGKMIPEWMRQGISPVIVSYDVCGDWKINATVYHVPERTRRQFPNIPLIKQGYRLFEEHSYFEHLFKIVAPLVKKYSIDVIFSFANPQESNVLGAMLKKCLKIQFISHFSDPWYDNPYKKLKGFAARKALRDERFVISMSDRIVFTNDAALELVMKKYDDAAKKRAVVIPHCYDPEDYPKDIQKNKKFTISYIGAFYKERNPSLFFQSIEAVLDQYPKLKETLRIVLVGATSDYAGYSDEKLKKLITLHRLDDIVEVTPAVSYKESLKYMKEADILVVIDADYKGSPFLPSKAVDYAGAGKIIVGITPTDSPTAKFLKNIGYSSFNYSEGTLLSRHLEDIMLHRKAPVVKGEVLEKFHVRETTR